MFSIWTLSVITLAYLVILFAIASWANKKKHINKNVYSLALGVHCTSWAFFGTATQASQFNWALVPTYFGCILVMLLGFGLLKRVAALCRQQQISSLSEFLSTRFFHSPSIAILVTLICFMGVIPYIALQLDAISDAVYLLSGSGQGWSNLQISFFIMLTMAAFVVLFGSRTLDLTQKHPGLMYSLAFESIVKLLAILCVGVFVVYYLHDGIFDLMASALSKDEIRQSSRQGFAFYVFASHALLGICAMFCLPRQFHVNFVENRSDEEIERARWLFPAYLVGMSLFILPIALAGDIAYGKNSGLSDQYVLLLPLQNNAPLISLVSLIGGIAASTSMVIVATLALGNMINTSVITPIWLRLSKIKTQQAKLSPKQLLMIRQLVICSLVFVAFLYHIYVSQSAPLVKSGTIAIALMSQLMPAIIASIYVHSCNAWGVFCGILVGAFIVMSQMLYPAISASYYFESAPTDESFADAIFISLLLNSLVIAISTLIKPNQRIHPFAQQQIKTPYLQIEKTSLLRVLSSVLTTKQLEQFKARLEADKQQAFTSGLLIIQAERVLSANLGRASARIILHSLADNQVKDENELSELVEQASQDFKFKHEVLQSSLAHLPQGVSVVDEDMCLIAWNSSYQQMFAFAPNYLRVGLKVSDILHMNAKRGLLKPIDDEDVETAIKKRLEMMRLGQSYKVMRRFRQSQVLEIAGSSLPGGGYITTYNDVTEYVDIQQKLEKSKLELEARVDARTQQLADATARANKANLSKTKFLAAAGHDLMQPVNAAMLLASMLAEKLKNTTHQSTSESLMTALEHADQQLAMLLEISKLDSDRVQAKVSRFHISDLFRSLQSELNIIASQKGLSLAYVASSCVLETDKTLLTRILQNLISNAIRYTSTGKITIGVRRRPNYVCEIWVCDTGSGIQDTHIEHIFEEFSRLDRNRQDQGLGLGLAIVKRISELLNIDIQVSSVPNKGSVFKVVLPYIASPSLATDSDDNPQHQLPEMFLAGKHVLILENDESVLHALQTQLLDWGAKVTHADAKTTLDLGHEGIDLIFADYHLNNEDTGVEVTQFIRQQYQHKIPAILSSADRSEDIREICAAADMAYLPKPVKSPALKRLISSLLSSM